MKKIFITIFIIVVLGAIAVFALTRKTVDWQKYQNSRYEFRMDYPMDWSLGDLDPNNAGRELYSPGEEVFCFVYGFANALQNQQGDPQSLDEFIDWLVNDPRVGEGLYTELLERNASTLDGKSAVHLLTEQDGNIKESVYVLGNETGIGFFCLYEDMDDRKQFKTTFARMVESIQIDISLDGESPKKLEECIYLLADVFPPLNDIKIFFDDQYTEVTITSREAWDQARLPKDVVNLEAKNYTCYPIPIEFDGGEAEGDVLPQPSVTMVEWSCELEYNEWEYVENKNVSKWEANGFVCNKEDCLNDIVDQYVSVEDFVWLCTK